MYTVVNKGNNLQQKPINSISVLLKDNIVKTINNVYVLTKDGIRLVWTAIKEILSAFGAGYWKNDKPWLNAELWENNP